MVSKNADGEKTKDDVISDLQNSYSNQKLRL